MLIVGIAVSAYSWLSNHATSAQRGEKPHRTDTEQKQHTPKTIKKGPRRSPFFDRGTEVR